MLGVFGKVISMLLTEFDPADCPVDCSRPCEDVCPANAISLSRDSTKKEQINRVPPNGKGLAV